MQSDSALEMPILEYVIRSVRPVILGTSYTLSAIRSRDNGSFRLLAHSGGMTLLAELLTVGVR